MERWRRLIGHDGYLLADLRLNTPEEGGRGRPVQSGYRASWWLITGDVETWLGSGPLDLLDGQRSIKPGGAVRVAIHPLVPIGWRAVQAKSTLHLRERVGQTLGVATVVERVDVPDDAPLRFDAVPLRPGEALLTRQDGLRARVARRFRRSA